MHAIFFHLIFAFFDNGNLGFFQFGVARSGWWQGFRQRLKVFWERGFFGSH
jgi:hypothetical protein